MQVLDQQTYFLIPYSTSRVEATRTTTLGLFLAWQSRKTTAIHSMLRMTQMLPAAGVEPEHILT